MPVRVLGFIFIAVLLRYTILNFGDTIATKLVLYWSLLSGISLGIYMLSVHPITRVAARNAQFMEILEDFIADENERLDFLVELERRQEGRVASPVNGKGSALFHLERKDRKSILKIHQ